jgi:two-component system, OmpR family, response regulator
MNILLVEDDLDLGNGVRIALTDQGMNVVWVRRLQEARRALETEACDLVVLDLGLPDGDGLELVTSIRQQQRDLPLLILTARDSLDDRIKGLDKGADDYLIKPFALAELLSRVRALARRALGFDDNPISVRGLCIYPTAMRVMVDGRAIELSHTEFQLLITLVQRADRVLTRRALEGRISRVPASNQSNSLEVHISNLRRKIGPGYIRTVRGVGYVVDRDAPAAGGES